ncbi:NADAR family protein [Streptomyces rectiverticillatus]|uniref:NADAR family protein n=1 Tax=Streptomyces rectiverticillatus TaxID=173860 RepID=UPI0015C2E84A|nr:NADAR family protein [Streptomyces rectiverticillatus]QLE70237.1 NADAR family protein [Streptomyces rectiverticillatus]
MSSEDRLTHRMADGVRVPGTWRHAFIRNGDYHLTDLVVYADGLVDCWGLVTFEEFEEKVRSGWVAVEPPAGARASAYGMASWRFAEPRAWISADDLIGEVRDTIDRLNGRPDSTDRCLAAVDVFLADRTEENRSAARAAYLAIPESQRMYALGDMDQHDMPLHALVEGPGSGEITPEEYEEALAYFDEWGPGEKPGDNPARAPESHAPAIQLDEWFVRKPEDAPGRKGLRNDYPAPIDADGVTYPSVAHAYWALSVTDPEVRAAIAAASSTYAARGLAAGTARREGWEQVHVAVMAGLLRAKYARYPELAEILVDTGDATLIYADGSSRFWGNAGGSGRNWAGRLLELARAELQMNRFG